MAAMSRVFGQLDPKRPTMAAHKYDTEQAIGVGATVIAELKRNRR
jgi:hypothetical protein